MESSHKSAAKHLKATEQYESRHQGLLVSNAMRHVAGTRASERFMIDVVGVRPAYVNIIPYYRRSSRVTTNSEKQRGKTSPYFVIAAARCPGWVSSELVKFLLIA
jgi:hypothetical protein